MSSEKPKTIHVTAADIDLAEGSPWGAFQVANKRAGNPWFDHCVAIVQLDGQETYAAQPKGKHRYLVLPLELQRLMWDRNANGSYPDAFDVPADFMEGE